MSRLASPIVNAITVTVAYPFEGHYWLEVPCADSDALTVLPHAVTFNGREYGRTGWNSDRCVAYYSTHRCIARW